MAGNTSTYYDNYTVNQHGLRIIPYWTKNGFAPNLLRAKMMQKRGKLKSIGNYNAIFASHKHNNFLQFTRHVSTLHLSSSVLDILKSLLNSNRARCYKVRYIATGWQYCVLKSLKLVTLSDLQPGVVIR